MLNCPVCKSVDIDPVLISHKSKYYNHCVNCKSFFLVDFSKRENVYTEEYTKNISHEREKYLRLYRYLKGTLQYSIGKNKGNFLEIGFSNPAVLLAVASDGWKATGIDLSCSQSIQNELQKESVEFIQGNILDIEIQDQKFDLIWMTHVIEHFTVEETKYILKKISKWLTPIGIVFISSPDASMYYTDNIALLIGNFKPEEHVVLYTPDSFRKVHMDCNFQRIWLSIYHGKNINDSSEFYFQTKGEWRVALKHE